MWILGVFLFASRQSKCMTKQPTSSGPGAHIVTAKRMREIEAALFSRGVTAEALMEEAGQGIATVVSQFFPRPGHCVVYAGKGNNAGDACVAARELRSVGWRIHVRASAPREACSPLALKKRLELGSSSMELTGPPMHLRGQVVVLDGLLGIGGSLPLREHVTDLCREINRLHHETGACVVAVDTPTGVDASEGAADPDAVVADVTVTLGLPKSGLFDDRALGHVGRIALVPLEGLQAVAAALGEESAVSFVMPTAGDLRSLLPLRTPDCHKGTFGHLAILAGSPGFTGAAVLSATAAVRAGAGLVTLFAGRATYATLAAAAPPEVMVKPLEDLDSLPVTGFNALVLGPGLGRSCDREALTIIEKFPAPCVVDADALNALSTNVSALAAAKWPRLLTPHPGEMARLMDTSGQPRHHVASVFAEKYPRCTLLLKGSRTLVAQAGRPLSANQTGSPALATGGTGDCLAGLCGALLAQGLDTFSAAQLSAWLHGRAAEIAVASTSQSHESFAAGDIPAFLGPAFHSLRNLDF